MFRRTRPPANTFGARSWKRAASLGFYLADLAHGIRCGWKPRWRFTDTRSAKRLMFGRRGSSVTARWRRASLSAAERWSGLKLRGRLVRWLDSRWWSAASLATNIAAATKLARRLGGLPAAPRLPPRARKFRWRMVR